MLMFASLFLIAVPAWQLIRNVENEKLFFAFLNVAQIAVYVLLMNSIL